MYIIYYSLEHIAFFRRMYVINNNCTLCPHSIHHHHHYHHRNVQEGLGLIPVPCILKMKLVPPISSLVVVCVFVLLVYIVVLV